MQVVVAGLPPCLAAVLPGAAAQGQVGLREERRFGFGTTHRRGLLPCSMQKGVGLACQLDISLLLPSCQPFITLGGGGLAALGWQPGRELCARLPAVPRRSVAVCPGGVKECIYMQRGQEVAYLRKRHGFVR